MTTEEAVAALNALADPPYRYESDDGKNRDGEEAHVEADEILLALVPAEVRAAYERVVQSCSWWAHA